MLNFYGPRSFWFKVGDLMACGPWSCSSTPLEKVNRTGTCDVTLGVLMDRVSRGGILMAI